MRENIINLVYKILGSVPGIFLGVKAGRPESKADNLTAICEPIVWKMWEPQRLRTLWAFSVCFTDNFAFFFYCAELTKIKFFSKRLV
jgi:hypothetical protein